MDKLTWEEFRKEWQEWHDDAQSYQHDYWVYQWEGGKMPHWLYRLLEKIRNPFRMARAFVLAKQCEREGHNLVDDGSWATPDSGGEAYRCTRCGESWRHVYY